MSMDNVSTFMAKNAWALIIMVIGVVGTYSVNSYRISAVENEIAEIKGQASIVNQMAVDLAVLRERTENQSEKIEEVNHKVDSIIDAFKIKQD